MPSVATDTDAFPSTVQRPNNGELADAASISQAINPLTQRTRYAYNRSRSNVFDVTRAPYNADPTGVNDSKPAIQAALDAASASGGVVVAPGGLYRLDTGLLTYAGVVLIGDPDRTRFNINHASQSLLSLNSPGAGVAAYVDGIRFAGLVANSGVVVEIGATTDSGLILHNCAWNGSSSNLQGTLVRNLGPTKVDLVRCNLNMKGTGIGLVQSHASGWLNAHGGKIAAPAVYGNFLFHVAEGSARLNGVDFDLTAHASGGTLQAVWVDSVVGSTALSGCAFRGNAALGTDIAIGAAADATLISECNSYSDIDILTRFSTGFLASGSRLDLQPSSSGSSLTLPNNIVSLFLRHTGGSDPTINMPAMRYPGQSLKLTVMNGHGSATWTPLIGTIASSLLEPIDAGRARSWQFSVLHNFTDYAWVCTAGPTPQFVP